MKTIFKYAVLEVETNKIYTFNGGYKASEFIGISKNTFYRNISDTLTKKVYNGYRFCQTIHNIGGNNNRGSKPPLKKR